MKPVSSSRAEHVRAKLRHAHDLTREGKHEEAISLANEVEEELSAYGVVSPTVYWSLAVYHDHAGHLLQALDYVVRALQADPAMVPAEQSLHIIVARCRESIVDGDAPVDERVALFRALAANDQDDDHVRTAYAECMLQKGDHAEALRVAQAMTVVSPRDTDAWRVVHLAALALGNEKLATEAAAHCMSSRCASGPATFGLTQPEAEA